MLGDGKIQEAAHILSTLVSEIRITTTNIPLGSFPGIIKNAVSLINAGKTVEAGSRLYEASTRLEKKTEVIAIPLLQAEDLLTEATRLEYKEDLSTEKSRAEVLIFADAAKDKLKLAELLGYGDKDNYKMLYTVIGEIKATMHSESSADTWAKIAHFLAKLKKADVS